ncbi:hypothetical protein DICSQDRAFT_141873 [Dichomitus squalens LYAD-421 SS1]|uniref:Uncharacterized protein n=1 Tax=Dichomitus squalens (strain LYAD-421) TaxID=732165 RepID=R7SHR4_DICSQ|nr:uncharacterized protein DICSQDRAFT_141873 [Dichomitus squalens LYAD-421 SS1]EJF55681.1 hypothetical protein DICSQDRAFT_141873 [Dichomitus squalens LYAD-421 SS1]
MIVKREYYEIFASILNDFGEGRIRFTYEQFATAAKAIGFSRRGGCELIPPSIIGKKVFCFIKDSMGGRETERSHRRRKNGGKSSSTICMVGRRRRSLSVKSRSTLRTEQHRGGDVLVARDGLDHVGSIRLAK